MRQRWAVGLIFCVGCAPFQLVPDEPATQQVGVKPFTEPSPARPTRVNFAPASQDSTYRVLLIKDRLLGENPTVALKPAVMAIGSPDPEIFHVGMDQIYITEPLIRQCRAEGELAAVLAFELGRMIAEREASVSDDVRMPERHLPIQFNVGSNASGRDRDPIGMVELALHEKAYPKHPRKLSRPNPHLIARTVLERAGYQPTDLDAVLPLLQNAERYRVMENQFKGTVQQGDWKAP